MKIARVFVLAYGSHAVGDILDVIDPAHHPGVILGGTLKEVEVADDFDKDVMSGVVAEDLSVTFEEDPAKVAAKILKTKEAAILDAYNTMNTEVYAAMAQLFGTTKSDSATAYYETWKLMKEKPALFKDSGLIAENASGGVAEGAVLDTEIKVQNWATGMIEAVEAYSVWRMERIKQFQDEKAAILAG